MNDGNAETGAIDDGMPASNGPPKGGAAGEGVSGADAIGEGVIGQDDIGEAAQCAAFRQSLLGKLTYSIGKDPGDATDRDWFVAAALVTRDAIVDRWISSNRVTQKESRKRVYYLSLEFLIGRLLTDTLSNLGFLQPMRTVLAEFGVDFEELVRMEPDAALGNGGLGRLAACFLESMATLGVASYGYGIRYDHGMFRQSISDGEQREYPETWLTLGNPWEFRRPDVSYLVASGGTLDVVAGPDGAPVQVWYPAEMVEAVAYDIPVVGWRGRHVNTLRLWSAQACAPLRLDAFNNGDFVEAVADQTRAETISQILYPGDGTPAGQELRLRQEYFFSSAALQDLLKRHLHDFGDVRTLAEHVSIQLNDTHPAIAVVELMRLLIDIHKLAWAEAWAITVAATSYTNHTLLPEALESWPVHLMERMLPRHMDIIYRINNDHLQGLRGSGHDDGRLLSSVSLIGETGTRQVRMGQLAFLGSHRVNGVSALHTALMRQSVFHDLHEIYPTRIVNKTNGITFRRWLFEANPRLTHLLIEIAGEAVLDDPAKLAQLAAHAEDVAVQERLAMIRWRNKIKLSNALRDQQNVMIDPAAMFDVQIKRIHEYKRQLLNILEIIALYEAMRSQPAADWVPRVKIFAGKAAAGYRRAKLIIKLIHDVAQVINNDPLLRGRLKVVFVPDYNVSRAELIIPAADLSEQISTAGMEASGTGNMKLALNGALTIGTLDGANIEIRDRVGSENMFIFGLTAAQVTARLKEGSEAHQIIAGSGDLRLVLDDLASGRFSSGDADRYRGLVDDLRNRDHFLICADFDAYATAQRQVDSLWRNPKGWWRASALNTAQMGWFSSDRAIREYCADIWNVPLPGMTEGQ